MTDISKPLSYEELKKLRKPIKNVNIEHKQSLSPLDKFAVWITDQVGSIGFIIIIFISQLARVLKISGESQ